MLHGTWRIVLLGSRLSDLLKLRFPLLHREISQPLASSKSLKDPSSTLLGIPSWAPWSSGETEPLWDSLSGIHGGGGVPLNAICSLSPRTYGLVALALCEMATFPKYSRLLSLSLILEHKHHRGGVAALVCSPWGRPRESHMHRTHRTHRTLAQPKPLLTSGHPDTKSEPVLCTGCSLTDRKPLGSLLCLVTF